MSYSKGIMWLDDCRIPFVDGGWGKRHNQEYPEWKGGKSFTHAEQHLEQNDKGRFTPNLLVCDDMLNDGNLSKSQRGRNDIGKSTYGGNSLLNSKTTMNNTDRGFDDKGTNSRYYDLDLWFDKMLEKL